MISIDEYQAFCVQRAKNPVFEITQLANFALGLNGEFGEVCDVIKKIIGQGHDYTQNLPKIKSELGDCFWYIAMLSYICDVKLSDLFETHETFQSFMKPSKISIFLEQKKDLLSVTAALLRATSCLNEISDIVAEAIEFDDISYVDKESIGHLLKNYVLRLRSYVIMLELDLDEIIQSNIDKLTERFKSGEFTVEESVNRVH